MAYVKVPKDLTKVKTKVALNMTKRQLIGFSIAALVGFPIYLIMKEIVSTDVSMIVMSIVVLPILFCTLYEKDGLPFEKHFFYIVKFHRNRKIRVYKGGSIYNNGNKNQLNGFKTNNKDAKRRRKIGKE